MTDTAAVTDAEATTDTAAVTGAAPVAGTEAMMAAQAPIVGLWRWVDSTMSDGTVIAPGPGTQYSLRFRPNGIVHIRADCNYTLASYKWQADDFARFRLIGIAPHRCGAEWQSVAFVQSLAGISGSLLRGDDLYLMLAMDSGSMHFVRQPLAGDKP